MENPSINMDDEKWSLFEMDHDGPPLRPLQSAVWPEFIRCQILGDSGYTPKVSIQRSPRHQKGLLSVPKVTIMKPALDCPKCVCV